MTRSGSGKASFETPISFQTRKIDESDAFFTGAELVAGHSAGLFATEVTEATEGK
ncbi:MAG: hypothetical protein AAGJ40_02330 [Planctomycetota bacterium]